MAKTAKIISSLIAIALVFGKSFIDEHIAWRSWRGQDP